MYSSLPTLMQLILFYVFYFTFYIVHVLHFLAPYYIICLSLFYFFQSFTIFSFKSLQLRFNFIFERFLSNLPTIVFYLKPSIFLLTTNLRTEVLPILFTQSSSSSPRTNLCESALSLSSRPFPGDAVKEFTKNDSGNRDSEQPLRHQHCYKNKRKTNK